MSVACCFNTGAHSSGGREQGASSLRAARPSLCSDGETQTEPGGAEVFSPPTELWVQALHLAVALSCHTKPFH